MSEEKSIREWLETLPEPYRTQAISQCECPSEHVSSLRNAVSSFAVWRKTNEGSEYWYDVKRRTALNKLGGLDEKHDYSVEPREVEIRDGLTYISSPASEEILCRVLAEDEDDTVGQANARLIVASSKLLQAVQAYLRAMDKYGHPDKTDRLMSKEARKAPGE